MRPIPPTMRARMAMDPIYRECLRQTIFSDHVCRANPATGKLIEWEHAFLYAGQQINEIWAIIPICWWVHEGPGKNKDLNQYMALRRATPVELAKYPRVDWLQLLRRLKIKLGL